jgi:predicted transcriptional regulator
MRIPLFTLKGFKRPREIAGLALGKLERQVMELAWARDEFSVRDIYQALDHRTAYTTVMTTLHRLYGKGILNRRKQGRAFQYRARVTRTEFDQGIARDLVEGLIARSGVTPLLTCLVDAVSEQDRSSLDCLDRLIRNKRKELKNRR